MLTAEIKELAETPLKELCLKRSIMMRDTFLTSEDWKMIRRAITWTPESLRVRVACHFVLKFCVSDRTQHIKPRMPLVTQTVPDVAAPT